jgi:hypothetical protein
MKGLCTTLRGTPAQQVLRVDPGATKTPPRVETHNKNVGQDQWEKFF